MEGKLNHPRINSVQVRVRYSETDRMGYVYHVNYLEYFELARAEWVRMFWKPYRQIEDDGYMLVVIDAHINYHRPVFYDEIIEVEAELKEWGRSRLVFEYRILKPDSDETVCTGTTGHCFVTSDGKPCRMPDELNQLLDMNFSNQTNSMHS